MLQQPATANSTRVILLRHGQSTYNEQKLYQGCCDDSLLNHLGKIQANLSGKFLNNFNIDTIYASPLKRTQETAVNIINVINQESHNTIPIKLHANLKEIDLPAWQGLPFKYVRQHLAEDYRIWEEKPHEFTIETTNTSSSTLIKTQTKPVL